MVLRALDEVARVLNAVPAGKLVIVTDYAIGAADSRQRTTTTIGSSR